MGVTVGTSPPQAVRAVARPAAISLRRNAVWTLAGNGTYLASQFFSLVVLSKLGSTELVGRYSLALAICTPISIFGQMQLRQIQATDVRDQYRFSEYFWFRLVCAAAALAAAVIAATVYDRSLEFVALVFALAGMKAAESIGDVVYGRMQRHERMDAIAISMIAKGTLAIAVFSLLLYVAGNLLWAVAGVAVVQAAVFLLYDWPVNRRLGPSSLVSPSGISPRRLWSLLVLALPMGLASCMPYLSASVPRYVLEMYEGEKSVALFSAAIAPLSLMMLFNSAITQPTLTRAAMLLEQSDLGGLKRLAFQSTAVSLTISLGCAALAAVYGEAFLSWLFTPEYAAAAPILAIMAAGAVLQPLAFFGSYILTSARAFYVQLANATLALAAHTVMCLAWIPQGGVAGAGWSEFGRSCLTNLLISVAGWYVYKAHRATVLADNNQASLG